MKTISTKVDESVYQKLVESCGISGNYISEKLRKLIENSLEPIQENKEIVISKKVADDSVKVNIIPELKHEIKTESNYAIINDQYFKKCEPLPKATNVRIIT